MTSGFRWISIISKASKEIIRDRLALFFSLLFPLMFIIIFGLAFGQFTGENTTYYIAVVNHDEGMELNNTQLNHGEIFIETLKELKYRDTDGKNTSRNFFDVRTGMSEEKAQELVEDRDISAYIIIPQNFSAAVFAGSMKYVESAISAGITDSDPVVIQAIIQQLLINQTTNDTSLQLDFGIPKYNRNATAEVQLQGNPSHSSYMTVSGMVDKILNAYLNAVNEKTLDDSQHYISIPIEPTQPIEHVEIKNLATEVSEYSAFDYIVPGVIVFALLMGSMSVSIFLARESSRGTLTRLKLTKMTSFDLLFGTTIPYTILAVIQMTILLGIAILIGYHYNSNANLGLAFIIVLIGALASVALGLILAAVAKNEDQAGSLAPAVCVPLSFLTGSFFPMPTVILSDNFFGMGRSFELFDWLPWTQCSKALGKVLTYGASFNEIVMDITLMLIFTIIIFAFGVFLYHKKRLRAE